MRPTVEALTPARDQLARGGHLLCDLLILPTVGGPQDNLGSQCEVNRDTLAAGLSLQLLARGFGSVTHGAVRISSSYHEEDLANNL